VLAQQLEARGWLPRGTHFPLLVVLLLGWCALYLPTYVSLSRTIWASDEQGHGPIILGISIWLFWVRRNRLAALPSASSPYFAAVLGLFAAAMYAIGRSQGIVMFEVGSQIPMLAALLLLFKGPAALRVAFFPLFFLLFMVPLPGALVSALTTPLKSAVSAVASSLLYWLGYPVGRTGVILTVGPYQLLVADACAGLNSMFTLEAIGLLYMNIMGYTSVARNVTLAILIIPIAFFANVIRVMILVFVTYYFGDEAGQGFIHDFAGMVLFAVALTLILLVDKVLGFVFRMSGERQRSASKVASA
jgi:exosortase B